LKTLFYQADDTCFHIHTEALSTWSYAVRVMENAYPTPKQTYKKLETQKADAASRSLLVAILKPFFPHKKQNQNVTSKNQIPRRLSPS